MAESRGEDRVHIENESGSAEPGCCLKMFYPEGRGGFANSQIKNQKNLNQETHEYLSYGEVMNSNPAKNRSRIRIAEPQQTVFSSSALKHYSWSNRNPEEQYHQDLVQTVQISTKSESSTQTPNNIKGKSSLDLGKNQAPNRKSINSIASSRITINLPKTRGSTDSRDIELMSSERKHLESSNTPSSPLDKSLIEPRTARGSISLNNIDRNDSKQSLAVSQEADSPLLHRSIISYQQAPSELQLDTSTIILQIPVMGFNPESSLDNFNMKRTQSICLSPLKPRPHKRTMTFAEQGLSEISDHHLEEEEDRLSRIIREFKRITHFQEYFNRGGFIGAGRVSSVYIVEDKATRFLYASKQFFKKIVYEGNVINRVNKEVNDHHLMGYHQNILSLYGSFEDSGRYYFITELCETNLRSVMAKPLSEGRAVQYIRDILQGLRELHSRNIIHKRLKPENIYLCGDTCKIGDFGWVSTLMESNGVEVDWEYSSPELIDRQGLCPKTDLWSLGVIAYEMVVGELPTVTSSNVVSSNQSHLLSVGKDYKSLLEGLLHQDPNRRFTINQAMEIVQRLTPPTPITFTDLTLQ